MRMIIIFRYVITIPGRWKKAQRVIEESDRDMERESKNEANPQRAPWLISRGSKSRGSSRFAFWDRLVESELGFLVEPTVGVGSRGQGRGDNSSGMAMPFHDLAWEIRL